MLQGILNMENERTNKMKSCMLEELAKAQTYYQNTHLMNILKQANNEVLTDRETKEETYSLHRFLQLHFQCYGIEKALFDFHVKSIEIPKMIVNNS